MVTPIKAAANYTVIHSTEPPAYSSTNQLSLKGMQRLESIEGTLLEASISLNDCCFMMLMRRALGLAEEALQAPPVRTSLGSAGLLNCMLVELGIVIEPCSLNRCQISFVLFRQ